MKPEKLYHFTCPHSRAQIGNGPTARLLLPPRHPISGLRVIWLTTEKTPDREKTGLTMRLQKCDRMRFRYVVTDLRNCRAWLDSLERAALSNRMLAALEEYGDPEHWWISSAPVPVLLDYEYIYDAVLEVPVR